MNNLFLYPEDFSSHKDWMQICDSLRIPYESISVEIIYERVYTEQEEEVNNFDESKLTDYV